jgi:hypothetical protein
MAPNIVPSWRVYAAGDTAVKWLRDNGLTIALMALFAISLVGQAWSGWLNAVDESGLHGEQAPTLFGFLGGGEFLSTLFENWESEFLQMATYVLLTAHLFQRGSAESRDPDDPERENDEAGPTLGDKLYAHSLGIAMTLLFIGSFVLHWLNSARHAADEARMHGQPEPAWQQHLGDAGFWFESFQNWQSEFLSTAVLVVLTIYLRERGSPESKPVQAPNAQTGA